jgi:hypothetical protein
VDAPRSITFAVGLEFLQRDGLTETVVPRGWPGAVRNHDAAAGWRISS